MPRVISQPRLPSNPGQGPHEPFLTSLLMTLRQWMGDVSYRLSEPIRVPVYVTADIPAAADHPGSIIYVSDASAGSHFQGSNGSAWVSLG